jgi:hypothetical protein
MSGAPLVRARRTSALNLHYGEPVFAPGHTRILTSSPAANIAQDKADDNRADSYERHFDSQHDDFTAFSRTPLLAKNPLEFRDFATLRTEVRVILTTLANTEKLTNCAM